MKKNNILLLLSVALVLTLVLLFGIFKSASTRYSRNIDELNNKYNNFIEETSAAIYDK